MNDLPKPPRTFTAFTTEFPELAEAWEAMARAGAHGPLSAAEARLVKLGVAVGAMREGAVHASVRKAWALGIEDDALMQVVALAAGTLGMPSAVAVYTWIKDELTKAD